MSKVQVHVGNLDDMGRRFVDAWHRAERGTAVRETHVTFLDLESMQTTLTPPADWNCCGMYASTAPRTRARWPTRWGVTTRTCIRTWRHLKRLAC